MSNSIALQDRIFFSKLHSIANTKMLGIRCSLVQFVEKEYSKIEWEQTEKFKIYINSYRSGEYIAKSQYSLDETNLVYLSVNNFTGILPNYDDVVYLDEELLAQYNSIKIYNGDFIVTRSGTIGHIHKVSLPDEKSYIPSHHLLVIKLNDMAQNNLLYQYWLGTDFVKHFLYSFAQGKSQKELTNWSVLQIPIPKCEFNDNESNKIIELEKEIAILKEKIRHPVDIINEIFSEYIGHDLKQIYYEYGKGVSYGLKYSNKKKGYHFSQKSSNAAKDYGLRFSVRFQRPQNNKLDELMMQKETCTLKSYLVEPIHRGCQPRSIEDGTINVVKTAQIKENAIDLTGCEMVSEEFYNSKNISAGINKFDVLLASTGKGSIGKVYYFEGDDPAMADGHVSILRFDQSIDPLFIVYYLQSILGIYQIEKYYSGATNQVELYSNQIQEFRILKFSSCDQKSIIRKISSEISSNDVTINEIRNKYQQIDDMLHKKTGPIINL